MKLFDLDHEFFRPLWVRIVVTAFALGWSTFEFITGAPFWGVLFGAMGLWCGWCFFIQGDYTNRDNSD